MLKMYQLYYLKSIAPQEMEEQFSIYTLFIKFNLFNSASKTSWESMHFNAISSIAIFYCNKSKEKQDFLKRIKCFKMLWL